MSKDRGKLNAVQFSERVAQHIADHALPGVWLRIFGTRRVGNGYKASDQWIGQVMWNPVQDADTASSDAFHVGEFLSNSPKAEQQLPRLQLGKNYSVRAYDPDSNDQIAECICVVGEDDEGLETQSTDPFSNMMQRVQERIMGKVMDEMDATVGMFTGDQRPRRGHVPDDGLIRLDNGSWVSKEWLQASLAQQRQQNRRLEQELEAIKDYLSNPNEEPEESPKPGIGQHLLQVAGQYLGQFLANRQSGGGSGGPTGIPGLDQILGALRQATPQTVGGTGAGFDQANPFNSLLASGMDLRTPPPMGGQMPMGPQMPMGGQMSSNAYGGQSARGFPGGQVGAPPFGQVSQGRPFGMDPSTGFNNNSIQGAGMPPGFGGVRSGKTAIDEDDDDYEDGGFDMSSSPEVKQLSQALFNLLMSAKGQGGDEYAKDIAVKQFIPLAKQAGISKQALMLMAANPENTADILFNALPADVRSFMAPMQSKFRKAVVEIAKLIDWNQE